MIKDYDELYADGISVLSEEDQAQIKAWKERELAGKSDIILDLGDFRDSLYVKLIECTSHMEGTK